MQFRLARHCTLQKVKVWNQMNENVKEGKKAACSFAWRFYLDSENRIESNDAVELTITVDRRTNGRMIICEYENRIGTTKINQTLDVYCKLLQMDLWRNRNFTRIWSRISHICHEALYFSLARNMPSLSFFHSKLNDYTRWDCVLLSEPTFTVTVTTKCHKDITRFIDRSKGWRLRWSIFVH